jgi:DNA-binding transcriptional regulator LsrR (DeoR family)
MKFISSLFLTNTGKSGITKEDPGGSMNYSESTLVEVAEMFYKQGLSQKEIANQLNLSCPTVSRMIRKIRELEIVEIIIHRPETRTMCLLELAGDVKSKLKLKEVMVVPQSSAGLLRKNMGKICAEWLGGKIKGKTVLGLAGGRSVASTADFVEKTHNTVEVVSLMGGINSVNDNIHSDMVVWNFSQKIGASSRILHSPVILADKNDVFTMKKNPVVSQVISLFDRIDLAIVGIGSLNAGDSLLLHSDLLNQEDIDFLKKGKYIGEMCGRFFNRKGREPEGSLAERTVAITLKQLRKIPLVCLMASGPEKVEGILAASMAGFINVLITGEETAKALLE